MEKKRSEIITPKNKCPNCGYYGRMKVTYTTKGDSRRVDYNNPLFECPRCREVF